MNIIDTIENRVLKDALLYVLLDSVDVDTRIAIEAEYRKRLDEYEKIHINYRSASMRMIATNNHRKLMEIL